MWAVTFYGINLFMWDVLGGREGKSFPAFSESPRPLFIFLLHLVWIPSGKIAVRQLFSMVCPYWQEFTEVSLVKCIQADQILPLTPWIQRVQISELRVHISWLLLTSFHNFERCFSLQLYHYCQTQLLFQAEVFSPDFVIAQSSVD